MRTVRTTWTAVAALVTVMAALVARKMGFHFALRRGEQIVEQFTDTAAFRSVAVTPAYWGQIELDSRK